MLLEVFLKPHFSGYVVFRQFPIIAHFDCL